MNIPSTDCPLCPRLVEYRNKNRVIFPGWHNSPVLSFGEINSELLVLGLAPGVKGANRTGRPFTGDHAGILLYATLLEFGFASGQFTDSPNDNFQLVNCRITNAVRCVPPQNKPKASEISACSQYLEKEIATMVNLKIIVALGTIAHNSALGALHLRRSEWKFRHNARHNLGNGLILLDSYHCSRYNTNTGRLTVEMFHNIFHSVRKIVPIIT